MKLHELADRLGATLTGGDAQTEITGVAGIEAAGPGEVTFVANPKYAALARTTQAAAVIVDPIFADTPVPTLRVDNPYLAFARAIECFYQPPTYPPCL
jgi:UDP-3-O-[3-hydroxymyristoyl] glucosamine N-acyltransferase